MHRPCQAGEEWFVKNFGGDKTGKHQIIDFLANKTKNHSPKEKIIARIQDLPNWVLFPDFERSEWFNKILDQLWPSLEGFIISKVSFTIPLSHIAFVL